MTAPLTPSGGLRSDSEDAAAPALAQPSASPPPFTQTQPADLPTHSTHTSAQRSEEQPDRTIQGNERRPRSSSSSSLSAESLPDASETPIRFHSEGDGGGADQWGSGDKIVEEHDRRSSPSPSPSEEQWPKESGAGEELMQIQITEPGHTAPQRLDRQHSSSTGSNDSHDSHGSTRSLRAAPNSFLQHDENVRTVLVWQNLTVTSAIRGSNKKKVLLDNVSGSMTGGMWAVMGPSGCGKSTLLNTLACRLDLNINVQGQIRLNGRPYSSTELKRMSGYVMQEDLLNENLTCRETLHYAAALRLPASMTSKQREARVNEVLQEMGLVRCQDVIVGNAAKKGLSGGERRRVCIGIELLTRPSLLFLDEPTSGLDSVTALALIQLLHRLTRSGKCSMLITIHQPQAKLFAMFDSLLLLKSGRILFQGTVPEALQLFSDAGFPVPHLTNPADHLLDVISPPMDIASQEEALREAALAAEFTRKIGHKGRAALDLELEMAAVHGEQPEEAREAALKDTPHLAPHTPLGKALSEKRKRSYNAAMQLEQTVASASDAPHYRRVDEENEERLRSKFHPPPVDLAYGDWKPLLLERETVGWARQVQILMDRNFREAVRNRNTWLTAMFQTILMAVLIGTVFLRIGDGQESVVRRQPVLFFLAINQGMFGALGVINSFPAERALMLRERAAGTYFASSYFIAKTTVDTLVALPMPIVFSCIVYWLVGLQADGAKFIIFTILMVLCSISATSLALMVSAVCKTTDLSVTVLPMVLEIARLFGGFFLSPTHLPNYFSWLDALSYVKYTYVGVSLNELDGLELSCKPSQMVGNPPACPVPDGQTSVRNLGLDYISLGGCIGVLCGYIIFCRICAYLAIRYMKSN